MPMQVFKAHVLDGRLVLDAPCTLPDGTTVALVSVDEVDQAALHRELRASIKDADSGLVSDFAEFLAELKAKHGLR